MENVVILLQYPLRPIFFDRNRVIPFQIALREADCGVDREFRFAALAVQQTNLTVRCADAFHDLFQDAVEQFFCRESLSAGGSQKSQAPQLGVQLLVSGTRTFQNQNDHGDAKRNSEQIIERDTHQEERARRPERTVHTMNGIQEEQTAEQLGAVSFAGGSPEQPTANQTQRRQQKGTFPSNEAEAGCRSAFQINQCQYRDYRKRPDGQKTLPCSNAEIQY